ncbi:glycosyl hydrolase 53 family protein [Cohnella sp.]|uniref:glycosyl hydrolase 53 family protein n=1 Tax=Cohnella sp. TaxID=1883426 RepID=UPI0037040CDF
MFRTSFSKIALSAVLALAVLLPAASGPEVNATTPFRIGLSISPFADSQLAAGVKYTDGVMTADDVAELTTLFQNHGANEMFVRVSTDLAYPTVGTNHSLTRALERADTAIGANLPLNVELGLWKHYGDFAGQPQPDFSEYPSITLPGAWETLTLTQMTDVLEQYGALVAQEFYDAGVTVNVWDLGNEVDFGTAGVSVAPMPGAYESEQGANWYKAPDGVNPTIGTESVSSLLAMTETDRIAWLETNLWPYEAQLLNAVREGILTVFPNAEFSTHISQSLSANFAIAFYEAMEVNGFPIDQLGFSLFPSAFASSSDSLLVFQYAMKAVKDHFGKPIFLAEFAYPSGPMSGTYAAWGNQQKGYQLKPEGQTELLKDLASWAAAMGFSGIRPWAPDLVHNGYGWEPLALFSSNPSSSLTKTAHGSVDSIAVGAAAPALDAIPALMDGFESNNFTQMGWTVSGADIQSTHKYEGSYAARFNWSDSITHPLLYGTYFYHDIKVEYARFSPNLTGSQHFIAEWFDGTSWHTLEDITGTFPWAKKTFTLPSSASNNMYFQLRFRTSGIGITNYAYVDAVKVRGEM